MEVECDSRGALHKLPNQSVQIAQGLGTLIVWEGQTALQIKEFVPCDYPSHHSSVLLY